MLQYIIFYVIILHFIAFILLMLYNIDIINSIMLNIQLHYAWHVQNHMYGLLDWMKKWIELKLWNSRQKYLGSLSYIPLQSMSQLL